MSSTSITSTPVTKRSSEVISPLENSVKQSKMDLEKDLSSTTETSEPVNDTCSEDSVQGLPDENANIHTWGTFLFKQMAFKLKCETITQN